LLKEGLFILLYSSSLLQVSGAIVKDRSCHFGGFSYLAFGARVEDWDCCGDPFLLIANGQLVE
jgi:hypothetical protein